MLLAGRSSSGEPGGGGSHTSARFSHRIPDVACPGPATRRDCLCAGFLPKSQPPAPAVPKSFQLPAGMSRGGGGGGGGPGCPMNTHQLGRFNLHLLNGLVTMGTREICGLCSKSPFSHHPKTQTWAGGPPGRCPPYAEGKEMSLIPPPHQAVLAEHPNPIVFN